MVRKILKTLQRREKAGTVTSRGNQLHTVVSVKEKLDEDIPYPVIFLFGFGSKAELQELFPAVINAFYKITYMMYFQVYTFFANNPTRMVLFLLIALSSFISPPGAYSRSVISNPALLTISSTSSMVLNK